MINAYDRFEGAQQRKHNRLKMFNHRKIIFHHMARVDFDQDHPGNGTFNVQLTIQFHASSCKQRNKLFS